ncbi:MAG: 4Fe-4S dicluster domain-containing protein [Deltaproteobacteria bacterium]|nr:4Fe-4S dicluster domain-containing protein [Deltaproteobacteria bacterium]
MSLKTLYAFFKIGFQLLQRIGKRLTFRKSPRLEQFLKNYQADGIVTLSREDKEKLNRFSHCLGCGLCDSGCPLTLESTTLESTTPSYLAMALSRGMPDFAFMTFNKAVCQDCRHCEEVCPTKVPLKEIFNFIESKKQALLT